MKKICVDCGKEKDITEFAIRNRLKNGEIRYRPQCKVCWSNREMIRYRIKKEFVDSKKTICEKCGDTRCYILDFHHKDPNEKDFTIGAFKRGDLDKIQKEIDKCVVLCANCHREFHYLNKENCLSLEDYLKK